MGKNKEYINGSWQVNTEMRKEFYTSGELNHEIDGVSYRGWWEYKEQ